MKKVLLCICFLLLNSICFANEYVEKGVYISPLGNILSIYENPHGIVFFELENNDRFVGTVNTLKNKTFIEVDAMEEDKNTENFKYPVVTDKNEKVSYWLKEKKDKIILKSVSGKKSMFTIGKTDISGEYVKSERTCSASDAMCIYAVLKADKELEKYALTGNFVDWKVNKVEEDLGMYPLFVEVEARDSDGIIGRYLVAEDLSKIAENEIIEF